MSELLSEQEIKALVDLSADLLDVPDFVLSADDARKVLGVIECNVSGSACSRSALRFLKKVKRKFEEHGCHGSAAAVDTLIAINLRYSPIDNWVDRGLVEGLRKSLNGLVETVEGAVSGMVKRMEAGQNGRIIPPVQLTDDPLDRQVDTDRSVKVVDLDRPVKVLEGS